MLKIFKHYIPKSLLILAIVEILMLANAFEFAIQIRLTMIGWSTDQLGSRLTELTTFVTVVFLACVAFGLYGADIARDLKLTFLRLFVALMASVVVLSSIFFFFPDIAIWRSIVVIALVLAFGFILVTRLIFIRFANLSRFKTNVLVLGTGKQAQRLVELASNEAESTFKIAGCVAMPNEERLVADGLVHSDYDSLVQLVEDLEIKEIVLALEERRGALPLQELLACKMRGCRILDFVVFVEKAHGYVDLDTVQPSWLIFSQRFGGTSRLNQILKRLMDIAVSLLILIVGLPIYLSAAVAIKLTSRGPIFYMQDRVGLSGRSFKVIKFRSMRIDAEADGIPKWADENDPRVTAVGSFIRAARIDELPQIFNVMSGEMSFVGPRPERPFFVDTLVGQIKYYNERHSMKPGITGWAQLNYPYGASTEDSKRKLQYDLYYIKNYSLFLDFLILLQTAKVVLWPDGVR